MQNKDKSIKIGNLCNFREKNIVEIKNVFFLFSSTNKWKYEKNPWKSHFLGRIFFFIQIVYIILVIGGFVENAVNTPKNFEKHVIYYFFQKKKIYCCNIQCFLFIFLWKQWNKQKIIEKFTFSVKINFFREMAYVPFFWTKIEMVFLR